MVSTTSQTHKVYDDFIDFLATGTTAESLIAFSLSPAAQDRLADLLDRAELGTLTADERSELDKVLVMEHLLRLAKAKAHLYLQAQATESQA